MRLFKVAAAILALLGAVALGGCDDPLATIGAGISLTAKSVANPVTRQEEAAMELAVDTGFKGLLAWKALCAKGAAEANCKVHIAQVQAYTRPMKPLVVQLRGFVDNNDQINASVVYNQLSALYTNVKTYAASVGVNVGG